MFKLDKKLESNINSEVIALTHFIFRNGPIEDIHAGKGPLSKTGDFSDVKVVTPYGEIPWNELSRITEEEMKVLNKFMVNRLALYHKFIATKDIETLEKIMRFNYAFGEDWDEPEIDDDLKSLLNFTATDEFLEKNK